MPAFDAFDGRYLSLTSFRRDGTPVATPVWFVREDGRLLVETGARSWKVRRIRRNGDVTVAVCTASGRLRGAPLPAHAELLPPDELARVHALLGRKYRFDLLLLRPIRRLVRLVSRAQVEESVALALTPRDGASLSRAT